MIRCLAKMIEQIQHHGMTVAEVGCHDGSSTIGYADIIARNHGSLILVDWFKGTEGSDNPRHGYGKDTGIRDRLNTNMVPFYQKGLDVVLIEADSVEAAKGIKDGSLDLCFIDADHRYSKVSRDIAAWESKVKVGGLFMGHDCEVIWPPRQFSEEELETDCIGDYHCGVIQAVWDRYAGQGVEIIEDGGGEGVPCWLKRM